MIAPPPQAVDCLPSLSTNRMKSNTYVTRKLFPSRTSKSTYFGASQYPQNKMSLLTAMEEISEFDSLMRETWGAGVAVGIRTRVGKVSTSLSESPMPTRVGVDVKVGIGVMVGVWLGVYTTVGVAVSVGIGGGVGVIINEITSFIEQAVNVKAKIKPKIILFITTNFLFATDTGRSSSFASRLHFLHYG
jgi:hypothetical protein